MALREDWFEAERLHRAARDGALSEISRLASEGFDIDAFDDLSRTPLHYAVEDERYQAAELLIELGADVNSHDEEMIGETPLSLAVQGNYSEMVELLLKHGANPDIQGWMGLTARIRASRRVDNIGRDIAKIIESFG